MVSKFPTRNSDLMKPLPLTKTLSLLLIVMTGLLTSCTQQRPRVLVFSKTKGYRHESIEAGKEAIFKIASKNNFEVDTTENASAFADENLKNYRAVIFLSTTGDVLNENQQTDFQRFIQAGGGYMGIHAAADTEYQWLWYGKLVGAYFKSHPQTQEAIARKTKPHDLTRNLPDEWKRTDEWYNYKTISSDITILYSLDETSYKGGENGDNHPIAWYHEFDGGRAFYTGMGHTKESFSDSLYLNHIEEGILYSIGTKKLDYQKATAIRAPEENRFTKVVLGYNFNEPTEMDILPDGRILFLERRGKVKLYDPKTDSIKVINELNVYSTHEDGMIGLTHDPDFEKNQWLYIFYSHPQKSANVISRFTFAKGKIDLNSEKEILEVVVQRKTCCHTGGSLAFGPDGNLYASTGDNTSPFESDGFSPSDERPDRYPFDAQKSAANANDLRGKILRIRPQPDGSYTIPEGNLFPQGTANTRPEIYVMGCRNPYRISIDQKTGFLYWGEVGPDAGNDDVKRGPRGYDEVNQAKGPGYFGWPYFVGNNYAYAKYDFDKKEVGAKHNLRKPVNNSPNNTGIKELPSANPAFVWYPYAASEDFPLVGKGGRNAMAGPVYYSEKYKDKPGAYPSYFDGKLLIYDWMRNWIMLCTMDKSGKLMDMQPFIPNITFNNIIDMTIGPDGKLYTLEYGSQWFKQNMDARLSRIDFNDGNRVPVAKLNADKISGSIPLTISFDAKGTEDPDGDAITYSLEWAGQKQESKNGKFNVAFDKAGEFMSRLTVTDTKGAKASSTLTIVVGNEPPLVDISVEGNSMFFFPNSTIRYHVKVNDKEDGSTMAKTIDPKSVQVSFDYLEKGFDLTKIAQGHQKAELPGVALMAASDCKSCHLRDQKSAGPAYLEIAKRYAKDVKAVETLSEKILNGGAGEWGETAMAAHPQLSKEQASQMVEYILSLANENTKPGLPIQSIVKTGQQTEGAYILQASYTDKGAKGVPSLSASKTWVFKKPELGATDASELKVVNKFTAPSGQVILDNVKNNSSVLFKTIDLTNVASLELVAYFMNAHAGGEVEVYLDGPSGKKLGATTFSKAPGIEVMPGVKMKSSKMMLEKMNGKHDLFLLFKNVQAGEKNLFFFGKVGIGD
jgi:cytochrome c